MRYRTTIAALAGVLLGTAISCLCTEGPAVKVRDDRYSIDAPAGTDISDGVVTVDGDWMTIEFKTTDGAQHLLRYELESSKIGG